MVNQQISLPDLNALAQTAHQAECKAKQYKQAAARLNHSRNNQLELLHVLGGSIPPSHEVVWRQEVASICEVLEEMQSDIYRLAELALLHEARKMTVRAARVRALIKAHIINDEEV